jgi:hypothetical protein
MRRDPRRAKVETLKRLDGDPMIVPRPSGHDLRLGDAVNA